MMHRHVVVVRLNELYGAKCCGLVLLTHQQIGLRYSVPIKTNFVSSLCYWNQQEINSRPLTMPRGFNDAMRWDLVSSVVYSNNWNWLWHNNQSRASIRYLVLLFSKYQRTKNVLQLVVVVNTSWHFSKITTCNLD